MLKALATAILLSCCLSSSAGAGEPEIWLQKNWVERPAPEWRAPLREGVPVVFLPEAEVQGTCDIPVEPGRTVMGCNRIMPDGVRKIIMPDPCKYPGKYAELMCHEMAHSNGWRHHQYQPPAQ